MTGQPPPRSWREAIPADEWRILELGGYGARSEPGARPALIVVDATYAFVGRSSQSLEEAVASYPSACGPAGWAAVPVIAALLAKARERRLPIVFTRPSDPALVARLGGKPKKRGRVAATAPDAREIVRELTPVEGELVLDKPRASGFFATPLLQFLLAARVDTVVVVGGTTSGCVRATVVDAASHGFLTAVIGDAVFDRSPLSHAVNLFDMEQKYAQVLRAEAAGRWLDTGSECNAAGAGEAMSVSRDR